MYKKLESDNQARTKDGSQPTRNGAYSLVRGGAREGRVTNSLVQTFFSLYGPKSALKKMLIAGVK